MLTAAQLVHGDTPEVCNGIDDDYNGEIDDGIQPTPTTCGVGACSSTGQIICQNGQPVDTCTPGQPTGNDDICNGIDENCDGVADDGYVPASTVCGEGVCKAAGETRCVNGQVIDTCTPGQSAGSDGNCNSSDGGGVESVGSVSGGSSDGGGGGCSINTAGESIDLGYALFLSIPVWVRLGAVKRKHSN